MSMGMGKGSNKLFCKEALAQVKLSYILVFLSGKVSLSHRCSLELETLSRTLCGPTRFHFLDKINNQSRFEIPVLFSLIIPLV